MLIVVCLRLVAPCIIRGGEVAFSYDHASSLNLESNIFNHRIWKQIFYPYRNQNPDGLPFEFLINVEIVTDMVIDWVGLQISNAG